MKKKPTTRQRADQTAWLIVLIFFVLWEVMVSVKDTPVYLLPAPSRVIATIFSFPLTYAQASFITIGEALAGLCLGVLAGILIASLLTLLPGLEDGVMTLAILIKSTPLVAIAPLLTLWLGFGVFPKIIITALLTFFPVLVNILSGMTRIDPALHDLFRSWNASRWEIYHHLRLPSAIPYLFTALKIAAPLSLIGAVVAEWTGASGGLGRTMWLAYTNLNLPFMFAAIFILAAAGISIYRLISWAEKRFVFWSQNSILD
jgi:ABC-type nitrate/sulfonate/bicarbonate transport system permease component